MASPTWRTSALRVRGSAEDSINEFRRGWAALLAGALGTACGILSITFYTQGLMVGPVTAEFGWTRSEFFLGFTVMQVTGLVTAPAVGILVDRFGARSLAIVGLIGHAAVYILLALTPGSLAVFYLTFAALAVCGAGTLPVTWTTVVNSWFQRHRGLAIGLTMAGTGLAAGFAPPLVQFFASSTGWRSAYAAVGLAALALALPVVIRSFHARPAGEGSGFTQSESHSMTRREAVRSYRFWALGVALFIVTLAVNGLIVNLVPVLLDSGWAADEAAAAIVLLAPAVVIGRVVAGLLVDQWWAPAVAALFFVQPVVAMLAIATLPMTPALAASAAILLGLAVGAELDLLAFMTSRYFGTRHYGAVFGGIYAFFTVASGLAPLAYATSHDFLGSYEPALLSSAAGLLVAIALLLSLGRYPGRPAVPPAAVAVRSERRPGDSR